MGIAFVSHNPRDGGGALTLGWLRWVGRGFPRCQDGFSMARFTKPIEELHAADVRLPS